jgi:hypothetical protein
VELEELAGEWTGLFFLEYLEICIYYNYLELVRFVGDFVRGLSCGEVFSFGKMDERRVRD